MTFLGDSLLDLFTVLQQSAGGTITVQRGYASPVVINFIRGRAVTRRLASPEESFYVSSHLDDFIVLAADYSAALGSEPIENDEIVWVDDNGVSRTFRLMLDGSERAYDPVGQYGLMYRLKAVEIT